MKAAKNDAERRAIERLLGRAAIANSKVAYAEFEKVFASPRFRKLAERGAQAQRPLWASTSTKNPRYRDVVYVEELIGPQTVNTLPMATIEAFRDHGVAASRIRDGLETARRSLGDLEAHGIRLNDVTAFLEKAGVESFSDSFHALIERIHRKEVEIGVRK